MSLRLGTAVLATLATAQFGAAQAVSADSSFVLAGTIVAKETGSPLGYSVVSIPAAGATGGERYTSAQGAFAFAGLPSGTHRLRVKHLGYVPRDVEVEISQPQTEVRVELTRVAVRLDAVRVVAREACTKPGPPDPTVSAEFGTLFEQVRQNAERFRLLIDRYPYWTIVERSFFDQLRSGDTRLISTDTVIFQSDHGWRYAPGRIIWPVVGRTAREYRMALPGLADVVDSAFLDNHCFRYAGIDTLDGRMLLRIDFYASDRLRTPDVDGAVYLDTATFQIRGARVALTRPPSVLRDVLGMTAMTVFEEVVPSIPVAARVTGTKLLRPRWGARGRVSTVERQTLLEVRFVRDIPGSAATRSSPPGT